MMSESGFDSLPYLMRVEGCLSERLGAGGLARSDLVRYEARLSARLARLQDEHDRNRLPMLRLPTRSDDLAALRSLANRFRRDMADVVVLGTGGSSLGARTLCALPGAGGPRLHFLDNIDPDGIETVLARIDPARTGYLVVSKSGSTAETLCQFAIVFDHWRQAATGREAADHFVAITVPDASPLRRAAARLGFPVLDHDPAVGGRFSILSLVGLLPAFIHGVDGRALREGAALVLDETLSAASALDAPPAAGAALLVGLAEGRGRSQSVLMPYIDVLFPFALWFRQLWAESLGKNGKGLTPIAARGAVDQHSQLQLYLDGPADKVVTMIQAAMGGTGRRIGPDWAEADSDLAYLGGRTMGDLMAAEQRATAETLIKRGHPVRVFEIDALSARTLGGLLMHFMLETVFAAELLGVDPFDQPAVEEGKVLAREYLREQARR